MHQLQDIVKEIRGGGWWYYVYVLYKPDSTPFYVGRGKKGKKYQRIQWHEYEASLEQPPPRRPYWNKLKVNTIRKIWREGGKVLYAIDSWHIKESVVCVREKELIASIGRKILGEGTLTNITEGGEDKIIPEETRIKISETLKDFYSDPENVRANSERQKMYFEQNPSAREEARQRAISNKSHEALAKWREDNPEALQDKQQQHGEKMKGWYQANSDKASELADRRNKVLKSKEHRTKMSGKTKAFMDANPDIAAARAKVMAKAVQEKCDVKQECLQLVQDKLWEMGEIRQKREHVGHKSLYRWRQRGLLEKHFPNMPFGQVAKGDWEKFRECF